MGFLGGSAGKEPACSVGDLGQISGFGKIPWRRERLPTPVFLPGEFHGLYSPWGHSQTQLSDFHFLQLIYNVVLVSGEEQNDLVIHIYIYFFQILFQFRLLQDIEYSSLYCTQGPCQLSVLYMYQCVYFAPKLLIYPSPLSSLVTISFYVCKSIPVL